MTTYISPDEADRIALQLKHELLKVYPRDELLKALRDIEGPPWPKEYVNRDTGKVYAPHTQDEYDWVYNDVPRHAIALGGEGGGKALALDTPLPTPTGWTTMADVGVGDYLLSDWGEPCLVTATSPVMEDHVCYNVVFDDGCSIVADAEHLWSVINTRNRFGCGVSIVTTEYVRNTILSERDYAVNAWHSGRRYYIESIEPCDSVPVKCVAVDSPSHLFLAGTGMIPTHNTVAGVIKTLERVRRGMSGVVAGPNLPHVKRSVFPELARWVPWDQVVDKHKERGHFAWEPYGPFNIAFKNEAVLQIGGLDDPKRWRGPNISFAFLDEIAVKDKPESIKVFDGRIRIPGPYGEPPQLFCATTPEMNWLYDYYGPLSCECRDCGEEFTLDVQTGSEEQCPYCESASILVSDGMELFKRNTRVILLPTAGNKDNLSDGYVEQRRQSLTEAEARVFLEAAWEDVLSGQPFLPSMIWWDDCKEELPILDKSTPIILVADAATGRDSGDSDCFGIMAISRHPDASKAKTSVAVRYTKSWQVKAGQRLNFQGTEHNPGPERELLRFCGWRINNDGAFVKVGDGYNVKCIIADPTSLHDMISRFRAKHVTWMREFGQGVERLKSDNDLLRLIQEKRVAHDGNEALRRHIRNADRKLDTESKKLRIVKRSDSAKIDLCVCLSMGSYEALRLNLA